MSLEFFDDVNIGSGNGLMPSGILSISIVDTDMLPYGTKRQSINRD